MRKNKIKMGQYVVFNRDLNRYWRYRSAVFKIASIPDESGMIKCDVVWNRNNRYGQIEVPYIHLKEVPDFDVNFSDWKIGDVLVPNSAANKFISECRMIPIVIDRFDCDFNKKLLGNGHGFSIVDNNIGVWFSPASHKRDDSKKIYKGLYSKLYYTDKIIVKDNGIVMPECIVKNSPCFNQIIKELKDSDILRKDAKF